MNYIDLLGYLASAFVLFSFFMTSMKKLRWISVVGCLLFIAYGLQIHSYPVMVTNGAIVLVNLYFLFQQSSNS